MPDLTAFPLNSRRGIIAGMTDKHTDPYGSTGNITLGVLLIVVALGIGVPAVASLLPVQSAGAGLLAFLGVRFLRRGLVVRFRK